MSAGFSWGRTNLPLSMSCSELWAGTVSPDPRRWVMIEWFQFKRVKKESSKLLKKSPCPKEPPKQLLPAPLVASEKSSKEDLVPVAHWLISATFWGSNSFVVWRLGCLARLEPKLQKNSSSVIFCNFLFLWVSSAEFCEAGGLKTTQCFVFSPLVLELSWRSPFSSLQNKYMIPLPHWAVKSLKHRPGCLPVPL